MGAAEEMEAGRKRSEYFANPTTSHPQPKTEPIREGNGAVPVNIDIVAAAPGNQRQAEGAKCEMPPSERPSEQKVLANAATMAEPPSVVEFFSRVLVWHTPETPGFCHIAWRNPKFDHGFSGKAYTRLIDFMAGRDWLVAHPSVAKDIWFATGQQREAGDTDKSRALRSRANTAMMKSIFLDVDVKDPPKGYANLTEALDALAEFCKTVRIPFPSAIVASGSGLQPYWISDRPLSVEEWRPYADGLRAMAVQHGLRCDGSVTIDCARVLRVPGTINNKTDPGRPVKLLGLAKADITFDAKIGHIRGVIQPSVPTPASTPKHNWVAALEPETPDAELKATAPLGTPTEYPPVKLGPVLKKCPYFKDAVRTGGTGADQGLWMMTVLATTFVEKGQKWAHELSKGHRAYVPADTDAMYERKEREKEERGLGWPSCAAFEQYGSKQCASCPHKGKIKSPLNLAGPARPLMTQAQASVPRQVKEGKIRPVVALMTLYKRGANNQALFAVLNENYAVVRYGGEIAIAIMLGNEVITMKVDNFHKMFANVRVQVASDTVEVSRLWFQWPGRRQYLHRGVVFEPGGPPDVPDDMLNLWRGFGIEPKQGDWTLMRNHIFNIVCSQQKELFDYLIRWLAYAVQHPNEPIGVAVAFRGAPGAGKGIVARTLGKIFGKHFAHIANGDQLTGRFNASLATSCVVFLDEALWAGDKKGEGVLKALITEPRLSLEAKFRDPIMVDNRLRIIVASNEDWVVPAGMGDRRWFILDVTNTFAGTGHRDYWDPLYAEVENGGAAAMFYDLLATDLSGFDVRAVPHTAAKAQQQARSLRGTDAWLYHILNEGAIGFQSWKKDGLTVATDHSYDCFEDFSKHQHHWRPDVKAVWSKKLRELLGPCMEDTRQKAYNQRARAFKFAPLADCRRQFATHAGAPNIEWESANEEDECSAPASQAAEHSGKPIEPDALVEA